ncbi:hypothetical protein AB1207_24220 [Kineococcus endophyticus]|uniref:Helix-turn-helix protein n=1 Tax=Kineococcus endophyticus TaxID=1181883 RepID=A0ABV3PDY9_9ACTN
MPENNAPSPEAMSPAELIGSLRQYGMTVTEIARELGRSPRMVRKVVRGESTGETYRQALTELHTTGSTQTRPARRRDRQGRAVPVRAPRGAEAPVVRPEDAESTASSSPATARGGRGTFTTRTTYLQGGARQIEVNSPRSEGAGRERGRREVLDALRRAARGRRRVSFTANYSNGRGVQIGGKSGYNASDALRRSRHEGNDPYAWLSGESAHRYEDIDVDGVVLTGVTITVW